MPLRVFLAVVLVAMVSFALVVWNMSSDPTRPPVASRGAPPADPGTPGDPTPAEPVTPARRILVAGIGNVFFGDDGFGVAVAGRLAAAALPPGVEVADFGIRGMDLAFALRDYDVAILVDAVPRGGAPGTLYVIEPELDDAEVGPDAHTMDPVKVLKLAQGLGDPLPRVLVVGCEPATVPTGDEDLCAELSEPVRASMDEAVRLVESLLDDLASEVISNKESRA